MADRAHMVARRAADPSLAELEQQPLVIDTLDLLNEVARQPELYYRVAKRLAFLRADRDDLKKSLGVAEARAQIAIIEADNALPEISVGVPAKQVKRKRTIGEIEGLVAIDPEVLGIGEQLAAVNRQITLTGALYEAYGVRKSSMNDAVTLMTRQPGPIDLAMDRQTVAEMRRTYTPQREQRGRDEHGQHWKRI